MHGRCEYQAAAPAIRGRHENVVTHLDVSSEQPSPFSFGARFPGQMHDGINVTAEFHSSVEVVEVGWNYFSVLFDGGKLFARQIRESKPVLGGRPGRKRGTYTSSRSSYQDAPQRNSVNRLQ